MIAAESQYRRVWDGVQLWPGELRRWLADEIERSLESEPAADGAEWTNAKNGGPGLGVQFDEGSHKVGEATMIYVGTVHDGVVVLPPDAQLPDGLRVSVQPIASPDVTTPVTQSYDTLVNGVPVFPPRKVAARPDLDLVNRLRDEEP